MNVRIELASLRPLAGDTVRQARASWVNAMMLAVTAVCSLLCLSVQVSGDVSLRGGDEPLYFLPAPAPGPGPAPTLAPDVPTPEAARREGVETVRGRLTLGFGAVAVPIGRDRADAVRFLEAVLAGGVAGTFGLLLALVWTAGFVPTFLEPAAASVLLAKPVARGTLLAGKYLSVVAFVGLHAALFVALTWLCLGARTGVWDPRYLACVPLLVLQFVVFYSFSTLLGVVTRSTVACVFGSVLYWLLSWGMNYGSVMARALPEHQAPTAATVALADTAYWVSPKPIDAALVLYNTMDAGKHFEKPVVFRVLESRTTYSPGLSVVSTMLLAGSLLVLSTYEFNLTEY